MAAVERHGVRAFDGRYAVRDGAVPHAGAGRAASSRTAVRPPRNGVCHYCGLPAVGVACHSHSDLPGLDPTGQFRDFLVETLKATA